MGEAGGSERTQPATSAGLLVLGMHRSGTSALARVLALSGADLGSRVSGAGLGNETGHWEDTTAVEVSERLLAAFGARWDDPFPLPDGWQRTDDALRAADEVAGYVSSDRAQHRLWVAKDPRLCLFGEMWATAALGAGQPASAIVLVRHPLEVARSLLARDGIALERGLLLWYDYTMSALEVAAGMPSVLVAYTDLLGDWRGTLARVSALPAGASLDPDLDPGAVDAFLQPGRRNQRATDAHPVGGEVGAAWEAIAGGLEARLSPADMFERLRAPWCELRRRWRPLAAEWRVERRKLWERVARSEALVANDASTLTAQLAGFGQALDRHQGAMIEALSLDLRRMQAAVAEHQAAAAVVEERRRVAEAGRLAAHEDAQRLREEMHRASGEARQQLRESDALARALREEAASMHADLARARSHAEALQREVAALDAQAVATAEEHARLQASLAQAHARSWEQAELLQQIIQSRSWRLTRPLRAAMRLLRGEWQPSDQARLRQALAGAFGFPGVGGRTRGTPDTNQASSEVSAPLAGTTPPTLPALAPPVPGLPDVFVWAVIDWRFRVQRPQHMARALAARGHRVFYLSNEFTDGPAPGFRLDPLDPGLGLYQVHLHVPGAPAIYHAMPASHDLAALRASLASVLAWTCTREAIGIVQHPYWLPLVRSLPAARVVYDCMDHHGGFGNNAGSILDAEARLVADADLVIVTSEWLERELAPRARATATIRNAGEFAHFNARPARVFRHPNGRRVIGYYGAIADWFDGDLVRAVAVAHPGAEVVLVGSDTAGVGAALSDLANVRMVGEVPYAELPYWLHGFDVCLLPFKVIPLTLATNPVKVYEYLAAGKPVVSVDLPEMAQFGDCVRVAGDQAGFVRAVGDALAGAEPEEAIAARKAFAAGQTWDHRAAALDQALLALDEPRLSVIVLAYNNLAFTQACLSSIEAHSDYRNLEVIVVDNASTDGSRDWLQRWSAEASPAGHARKLILNQDNLGFAAGNNVGLQAACGEVLVLLNNDTYVTPGWVRSLANHLRSEPGLGLVGPVTNNIGNEAKIEIEYDDMAEMIERAGRHTRAHPGARIPLATVAFFCVAMRREVYQQVGGLDEQFGMGFFEDDDYCRRVEQAGYAIACAEDVFVHHHLSASFDQLKAAAKQALFEKNRALYEAKWGAWSPHRYRHAAAP